MVINVIKLIGGVKIFIMFKNFKIRKKLVILVSSILLFSLLNVILSLNIMKTIKNNSNNFIDVGLPSIIYGAEIKADIAGFRAFELRYILEKEPLKMKEIKGSLDRFRNEMNSNIEECNKYMLDSNNKAILNDIVELWRLYLEKHNKAMEFFDMGMIEEANKILVDESYSIYSSLRSKSVELVDLTEDMAQDMSNYGNNIYRTCINISIICTTIILIVSSFISKVIIDSITKPVEQLENAMINLSEGNLNLESLTYKSEDELGSLTYNMRNSLQKLSIMINDLLYLINELANGNFTCKTKCEEVYVGEFKPLITNFRKTREQLNEVLNKINESAEQVAAGAEQLSSSAQESSQGATQQASAVQELAATINDIYVKIQKNAESAEISSKQAGEVGEGIVQSNEKMQQMVSAMSEIINSSNEISKIIQTIEDIAFQTNILALNAAVEAARAGTAGKGFAVVADEVRNLASKSAEASKNTAQLIECSIDAVQRGNLLATDASNTLMDTVEYAKKVINTIAEISEASIEQSDSVSQVTQGIDQISIVVQNNSTASEQSATTSEELATQAQILKDLINKFTLE